MQYVYSVARFVPDPARGEFINVGIVVGSDDSDDWALRTVDNLQRANRLDNRGVLPEVMKHLTLLGGRLDKFTSAREELFPPEGIEQVSVSWLKALADEYANILQLTNPRPLLAESADEALDILWEDLILETTSKQFRFLKKHRAVAEVRRVFRERRIGPERVVERALIHGHAHESSVDFVVHNGYAERLTNCWSFQLPNKTDLMEQIKAWSWTVRDLRHHGGWAATADDQRFDISKDIPIAVVFVPPADPDDKTLQEANSAFDELDVSAIAYDEADRIFEPSKA